MTCELEPGREGRDKHIEKVGTGERTPQTKGTVYAKATEMWYLMNRREASGADSREPGVYSLK